MGMEQHKQYFRCPKNKRVFVSVQIQPSISSFSNSREEKACAWPPRSYSCTFCAREFRSAQALGGHMNVHRRDRARLKQSPPTGFAAPRFSATVSVENSFRLRNPTSPPGSSDDSSQFLGSSRPEFPCRMDTSKELAVLDRNEKTAEKFHGWNRINAPVETSLSVGLSLAPKSRDEESFSSKRQRKGNDITSLLFLNKSCTSNDRYVLQSEALRIKKMSSFIEENIDLELRLGDPPTVK